MRGHSLIWICAVHTGGAAMQNAQLGGSCCWLEFLKLV